MKSGLGDDVESTVILYNFLTNILPDTVLCIMFKYVIGFDIIPSDYCQAGIVFYFVGIVNCRVGSLIIGPVLKKISWVKFSTYSDFIQAEKEDSKLTILSQENNVYRSYISVMLIAFIGFIYTNYSLGGYVFTIDKRLILILSLLILFLFAYRKRLLSLKRVEKDIKDLHKEQN